MEFYLVYVGSIKLSYLNGVFFAKSIGHIYLGIFKLEYLTQYSAGLSQAGWGGGWGGWGTFSLPPQFLADQLILSQPGGAHYPHPVLQAPPDFQTLRRP